MGNPAANRDLTEILVQGDKHATLLLGNTQQRLVAGIQRPVARQNNVMSGLYERRFGAARR